MATKKKLLQAAAGTAAASGGAGALNVEDVFSTYLYEGNGSGQSIQNGVNLGQSFGSGSARFGGTATGEYLQTPISTDFQLGNGDFTVEFFMNITDVTGSNQEPFSFGDGTGAYDFLVFLSGGDVQVYMSSNGSSWDLISAGNCGSYTIGKWHHVAVTRSSAGIRGFLDGVQGFGVGTSATINQSANQISIGRGQNDKRFNGYISDFHFIKGTEKYSTNFTPPTSALTAHANTKLLTLQQDDLLTDNSTTGHTITEYGGSIYDEPVFGPFDAADAGEGGLVWTKVRTQSDHHYFWDTERGVNKRISPNNAFGENTETTALTSFNSNGFTLGSHVTVNGSSSDWGSAADYCSWTFRKAPKFFDVVTYTGDGTAGRTVSHNLGTTVGSIFIKRTDTTQDWIVYHRGLNSADGTLILNENFQAYTNSTWAWNSTYPTSTDFTLGSNAQVNASGGTYVAYLFAHNDGDGDFGPDGNADIIKCGSYTTDANEDATVDLGFEPQWVLAKRTDSSTGGTWTLYDSMRGLPADFITQSALLEANDSNAENNVNRMILTPTGFKVDNYGANRDYIYIAIRRGPMAVPTDATDVFGISNANEPSTSELTTQIGVLTDMVIQRPRFDNAADWNTASRLTGKDNFLNTNTTDAEENTQTGYSIPMWTFDNNDYAYIPAGGFNNNSGGAGQEQINYSWKRARGYFDCVAYSGNGTAGRTVSHNLGVAPEMMWVKRRDAVSSEGWFVYHRDLTSAAYYLNLNSTAAESQYWNAWNSTAPTSSVFSLGNYSDVNSSSATYIAYLFASLDGVSKCGSFSHTSGSNTDVDCGFSNGARFVLIKRTDNIGHWITLDTERGIVTGNDAWLSLNLTSAENTSYDLIDPLSSGFTVDGSGLIGTGDYIFYAIA